MVHHSAPSAVGTRFVIAQAAWLGYRSKIGDAEWSEAEIAIPQKARGAFARVPESR
jgi:hypothetical protein